MSVPTCLVPGVNKRYAHCLAAHLIGNASERDVAPCLHPKLQLARTWAVKTASTSVLCRIRRGCNGASWVALASQKAEHLSSTGYLAPQISPAAPHHTAKAAAINVSLILGARQQGAIAPPSVHSPG